MSSSPGHEMGWAPADPKPSKVEPPKKRKRIPQACKICRDRKIRCDAQLPACTPCRERGVQESCKYDEIAEASQKYIEELKEKIRRLEAQVLTCRESHLLTDPTPHRTSQPDQQYQLGSLTSFKEPPSIGDASCPCSSDGNADTKDLSGVDALATVSSLDIDHGQYEDSSTTAFVTWIQNALETERDQQPQQHNTAIGLVPTIPSQSLSLLERSRAIDLNAFVLPPRYMAEDFLNCFWEFIHPLFPILHKPIFTQTFERLWVSSNHVALPLSDEALENAIFLSTLNVVFALGCQFSRSLEPSQRASSSAGFYQRSRSLFVFESLDAVHLPLLQNLLLNGVYLQSTKLATRCWNVVGLAIRVAYGLGLHRDQTGSLVKSQVETEMRRRIWHTCVMLDRLLAMTFGRPTTIPRTWSVGDPSSIDDEYLARIGTGMQPQGRPSRLGLFVQSVKLFDILDDILSIFYASAKGTTPSIREDVDQWFTDHLVSVNRLNQRLEHFKADLPAYLEARNAIPDLATESDHITLQVSVLHCRFLYTRILLLRPVLLSTLHASFTSLKQSGNSDISMAHQMLKGTCILCVSTAHDLLARLHENLGDNYRSTAWHSVYFTFAAATVLIAAELHPDSCVRSKAALFETSWRRCLQILQHYRDQVKAAHQATMVLTTLHRRIKPENNTPALLYSTAEEIQGTKGYQGNDLLSNEALLVSSTSGDSAPLCGPTDFDFQQHVPNLGPSESWSALEGMFSIDWLQLPLQSDYSFDI